jgi:hypothetical protein
VDRFAAKPWPGFMPVILWLIVSATRRAFSKWRPTVAYAQVIQAAPTICTGLTVRLTSYIQANT